MPELIVIAGVRDTKGGMSAQDRTSLHELRQQQCIQLWSAKGSAQECEEAWRKFCLVDMPEGSVIYG